MKQMRDFKFFHGYQKTNELMNIDWDEINDRLRRLDNGFNQIITPNYIPTWTGTTYTPSWVVNPGLITYTPQPNTITTTPSYGTYTIPCNGTITTGTSTGFSLTTSNSNGITYTTGGFGGILTTNTATYPYTLK
jgi:hypothetical protein